MSANDTPETLAAILVDAQSELATLLGHEQRAWAEVYQLEGQCAEADAAGQIVLASTLLNQLIIKKAVARGVAIETQKAYSRVQILKSRIADAEARARDHAALFARITADQASGMDDQSDFAVGVAA